MCYIFLIGLFNDYWYCYKTKTANTGQAFAADIFLCLSLFFYCLFLNGGFLLIDIRKIDQKQDEVRAPNRQRLNRAVFFEQDEQNNHRCQNRDKKQQSYQEPLIGFWFVKQKKDDRRRAENAESERRTPVDNHPPVEVILVRNDFGNDDADKTEIHGNPAGFAVIAVVPVHIADVKPQRIDGEDYPEVV